MLPSLPPTPSSSPRRLLLLVRLSVLVSIVLVVGFVNVSKYCWSAVMALATTTSEPVVRGRLGPSILYTGCAASQGTERSIIKACELIPAKEDPASTPFLTGIPPRIYMA
ncbi:hypothetical protein B0O80DRAFT_440489 [Mortierella sp. GBAus27b]|nr:hypothetical protein B0O80DRAFT_440489 [Mortierella sp. GBAus27b]